MSLPPQSRAGSDAGAASGAWGGGCPNFRIHSVAPGEPLFIISISWMWEQAPERLSGLQRPWLVSDRTRVGSWVF